MYMHKDKRKPTADRVKLPNCWSEFLRERMTEDGRRSCLEAVEMKSSRWHSKLQHNPRVCRGLKRAALQAAVSKLRAEIPAKI